MFNSSESVSCYHIFRCNVELAVTAEKAPPSNWRERDRSTHIGRAAISGAEEWESNARLLDKNAPKAGANTSKFVRYLNESLRERGFRGNSSLK